MRTEQNELKSLLEQQNTLCVSLYIPLRISALHENLVRVHHLLKQAEDQVAKVTCATEAHELLRPIAEAIPAFSAAPGMTRGLAAFASEGFHRVFPVTLDLPEMMNIGRQFHILPLLPLFSDNDRFYILALSQKHIRVFQADRDGAQEIVLDGLPVEFDSAHQDFLSEGFEKELQFHAAGAGGSGKRSVIYHGGADEPKDRFTEYLRRVSTQLFKILNFGGAPLVVASVDRLISIYRQINEYPNLVEHFAAGNPDLLKTPDLHRKAWEAMESYFAAQRMQFVERFKRFPKRLIDYDAREIVEAAKLGRVRTLFIGGEAGKRDGESECLFNLAVSLTLRGGGAVHELPAAEMPENAKIAAVYRY